MNNISIRNLRENLADIANQVSAGAKFEVYRRSKPAFKIVPIDTPIDDQWETVVDFTAGGTQDGLSIEAVMELVDQ